MVVWMFYVGVDDGVETWGVVHGGVGCTWWCGCFSCVYMLGELLCWGYTVAWTCCVGGEGAGVGKHVVMREGCMLCRGVHGLCWCTGWLEVVSGCTGG